MAFCTSIVRASAGALGAHAFVQRGRAFPSPFVHGYAADSVQRVRFPLRLSSFT